MKQKFKRGMYATGKRDANEKNLFPVLKARNIKFTQLIPGQGADLILWVNPMIVVEVKNPELSVSEQELTEKEIETRDYCEIAGIPWFLVKTEEDLLKIINDYFSAL